MEDDDQDKYQDQGQEEDQSLNEETQLEEANLVHQYLPKDRRTTKDNPIHNVIRDIYKGVITRKSISKNVIM